APMGLSSVPATNAGKANAAHRAGELVLDLLRRDVTPLKIITKAAIENAIAGVATTGGSTNAVLHLLAIANEAKISLSIEDFDRISSLVPILADLKPGGRFVATDLYAAGGTALVAKRLLEAKLLRGNSISVTGRTLAEEAAAAKEAPAQQVVRKLDAPLKPTGGLVILKGNLAPEGCVVKVAGHNLQNFRGPARVFDNEEAAFIAVDIPNRQLNVELSAADIQKRLATWKPPRPRYLSGVMAKYALLVSSASLGAVTALPASFSETAQPVLNARTL